MDEQIMKNGPQGQEAVEPAPDPDLKPTMVAKLEDLSKEELIRVLRQKIVSETNMSGHINDQDARIENLHKKLYEKEDFMRNFQENATKVIKENQRHAESKLTALFSIIDNVKTLLSAPDYSFLEKPEKE